MRKISTAFSQSKAKILIYVCVWRPWGPASFLPRLSSSIVHMMCQSQKTTLRSPRRDFSSIFMMSVIYIYIYFYDVYEIHQYLMSSNMSQALVVQSLSHAQLFVTPWTATCQAPLSMGFSRQDCWSGVPFPSPGDLLNPGIEPWSPALQGDALPSELLGKPKDLIT